MEQNKMVKEIELDGGTNLEKMNDAEALLDAEALGVFGGIPTNGRYEAKLRLTKIIEMEAKMRYKIEFKQYLQSIQRFIMTSRFNAATWQENCNYRTQNPKFGCIYCSPCPVSGRVPTDSVMFVLEMNNDENRIMGIGMVKNHPRVNGLVVYKNCNYNRYQFYGKHRIDRVDMVGDEEAVMTAFDILCFTGNSHQKRGHGLKVFPLDMLFRCMRVIDLVEFITGMFKRRMGGG